MISLSTLRRLLLAAIGLPIAVVVAALFGRLLRALGDVGGGQFVDRAAVVLLIAWVLTLIGLLLAVAARLAWDVGDESE